MTTNPQVEAILWCDLCRRDKFQVNRVPAKQEGHFLHELEVLDETQPPNLKATCADCGSTLKRKE